MSYVTSNSGNVFGVKLVDFTIQLRTQVNQRGGSLSKGKKDHPLITGLYVDKPKC